MLRRVCVFLEELRRRGQNSRRTEPTLQGVMPPERLLEIVQVAVIQGEAFNRDDGSPIDLRGEQQARTHRPPIDQNGASAANAVLAANMRAVLVQNVTQHVGKLHTRLGLYRHAAAVERELNRGLLAARDF